LRTLELRGDFDRLPRDVGRLARLRLLRLRATSVKAAERARIAKALPGCRIDVRET